MDIKSVIKERGWTIERVAAEMPTKKNGVETKGINRITLTQTLGNNPTIGTLRRIADIIGCQVADFFKDELPQPDSLVCPHCGKPMDADALLHYLAALLGRKITIENK